MIRLEDILKQQEEAHAESDSEEEDGESAEPDSEDWAARATPQLEEATNILLDLILLQS
ncbi:MAG: hypothetical protein ACE5FL_00905 [Myxococcota bacterium]